MAPVTTISYDTNWNDSDQDIDALLSGIAWDITGSNVITYSFPTSGSQLGYSFGNGASFGSGFTSAQRAVAIDAMDMVESYTNIDFQAASGGSEGTIRFFNVDNHPTAFGYYPNSGSSGGDMGFRSGSFTSNLEIGTYETTTFMHELGHALGLKHGHESGCCCSFCAGNDGGPMPTDKDSMEYSLMTYRSFDGHDLNANPYYTNKDGSYAQTFMISDIAALQRMYGADYSTNSGDNVYTFDPNTGEMFIDGVGQGTPKDNKIFRAVWDGNGNDTYSFTNYTTNLSIDLRPGMYTNLDRDGNFQRAELNDGWGPNGQFGSQYEEFADGHIYNAYLYKGKTKSLIENANGGSGNDIMRGNEVKNMLRGNDGKDTMYGYQKNDTLKGGNQNDKLFGGNGRDTLQGGNGKDKLQGDKGNDSLKGGKGDDIFIFGKDGSTDRVLDFDDKGNDVLDFSAFNFATKAAARRSAEQDGNDVVFNIDGTRIILEDTDIDSITNSDFIV